MSEQSTDWGFWGFIAFVVLVFWYMWETDTTRATHPDHKPNYEACQRIADSLYAERLDEAISDPSKWQLAGDRNAREYAERSRKGALSRCTL